HGGDRSVRAACRHPPGDRAVGARCAGGLRGLLHPAHHRRGRHRPNRRLDGDLMIVRKGQRLGSVLAERPSAEPEPEKRAVAKKTAAKKAAPAKKTAAPSEPEKKPEPADPEPVRVEKAETPAKEADDGD